MGVTGKRAGLMAQDDVREWLDDVNTKADFGPPPTEEEFRAVQEHEEAARRWVTELHAPVPEKLDDRLSEDAFRDGLARIWRLVTAGNGLRMHVDLLNADEGETTVEGVVLHVNVGVGPAKPFGDVPDPV